MATAKQKQWRPSQNKVGSDIGKSRSNENRPSLQTSDSKLAEIVVNKGPSTISSSPSSEVTVSKGPPRRSIEHVFIPYLPQDDAVAAGFGAQQGAIDALETQQVADVLNEEFSKLLKMQAQEFWRTVTKDESIKLSLDSYLQFRRRWYDEDAEQNGKELAGVIVGDTELHRRVFMVLYRMSLPSESGPLQYAPSTAEMKFKKEFFDVPKLLDICAIYGHDNQVLTQKLVNYVFTSNKKLREDLVGIVPVLSNTIHTMHERCFSTLTMHLPTTNAETAVMSKLQNELIEVLKYLNDVVLSLHSFVIVYPDAAVVLVSAGSSGDVKSQLLPIIASMHDALIPTIRRSFSYLRGSEEDRQVEKMSESLLMRLRFGTIELAWKLFQFSYLCKDDAPDVTQSQKSFYDPRARGEAFVQALSSMMEHSFELSLGEDTVHNGVLIRNIERKHKLLDTVNQLADKGVIVLDNVQYDYVEAMLNPQTPVITSTVPKSSTASTATQEISEVDILNESKISHIKDIFPDYGNGFISACLEAYDNNPEEVIQRILEGTLHPSLQVLDITLEAKPQGRSNNVPVNDKGKGKIEEGVPTNKGKGKIADGINGNSSSSAGIHGNASASAEWSGNANGQVQRPPSMPASTSSSHDDGKIASSETMKGRFVRKFKNEGNALALLDERNTEDDLRTAAYAAQYEDEYDDSFDDLGSHVADGVEETEILADMAGLKGPSFFEVSNKMHTGSKSTPSSKRMESANNFGNYDTKSTTPRDTSSGYVDTRSQPQVPYGRGRGRGRRNEPKGQFFVKDGKNYSYKVAGSVAVANVEEAEALQKQEEETIYGLGRGGNVPILTDQVDERKKSSGADSPIDPRNLPVDSLGRGRGSHNRGRGGPRKNYDQHHRKDRALKKHFASVGGL